MAIEFNNIPDTQRTPGIFVEIDSSRALKGLVTNPHKVLILGQKIAAGSVPNDTLVQITDDALADGYFGSGSILARMCNIFKADNPNTEVWALPLSISGAPIAASGYLSFSGNMVGAETIEAGTLYLMINGQKCYVDYPVSTSGQAMASLAKVVIDADSTLPVHAGVVGAGDLAISAVCSGSAGNDIDIRFNYYEGQSFGNNWSQNPSLVGMADGTLAPDVDEAWAIVGEQQFHHIINPFVNQNNLDAMTTELSDRFQPLEDIQGYAYHCYRGILASQTSLGISQNSPYMTIMGVYDSPTDPAEWAAALGAVAAGKLEEDPARPLHYLKLGGVLAPPVASRWTRAERQILLWDGIATYTVDTTGNVLIDRCITTYQKNAVGVADPTYLDIQTLFNLMEIRHQFKVRMISRFLDPRFKLADDSFPVQPGTYVATPKTVRQEIIALLTELRDAGLIENLDECVANLRVERDATDQNRVNVLLAPDLINQFRILAAKIQFIL